MVVVGLEVTNAILPSLLCAGPMFLLVAMPAIFKATLGSGSVAPKDKEWVTNTSYYLAEILVTMAALRDKSMPAVVALYNAIP